MVMPNLNLKNGRNGGHLRHNSMLDNYAQSKTLAYGGESSQSLGLVGSPEKGLTRKGSVADVNYGSKINLLG